MTIREKLRRQLSDRLIPELKRRGFDGPSVIRGSGLMHAFRRRRGEISHVFEIQFEKYGLPRFVINIWIEPSEGTEHVVKHGGTIIAGRATPKLGGFTRSWFQADPTFWQRLRGSKSRESEAVSQALAMMEEFEMWWSKPQPAKHIIDTSVTYPGVAVTQQSGQNIEHDRDNEN